MRRLLIYGAALLLLLVFLYRKWDELTGIAAVAMFAVVFSLLLSPLCARMEKHGIKPSRSAAYSVVGFAMIVLLMIAAFIPYLASHSVYLIKRISPIAAALTEQATSWADETGFAQRYMSDIGGVAGASLSRLTGAAARFSMAAAAQTGRIVFSLVLTYYVLCDRKRIGSHLLLLVPVMWRRAVLAGLCGCRNAVMSYFAGMLKTSAFVCVATALGLMALGIEDALLLALFMGIFEILPYVGPALAAIPILLSSLLQGMDNAIGALILIILVQQVEGNFVSPYFTASSTSVHPLAAVAGVFVLGSVFGIWGILTAIPLMVIGQSILWSLRQTRHMIHEEEAGSLKSFTS